MIRVNLGSQQRRQCKDITHLVEVSPSPCDKEAYDAWWKAERQRRKNMMPMVIDKKKEK